MPDDSFLSLLQRACESIEPILQESAEPYRRAILLAQMIRSPAPAGTRWACALRNCDEIIVAVVDDHNRHQPNDAESLLEELSKYIATEPNRASAGEQWPRTLVVDGRAWALEHICFQEKWQGILAAAVPDQTSDEDRNALGPLLHVCCLRLEHRLELESLDRRRATLEREIADLDYMADLGELGGPVVHELRNHLNSLLLHLALLEQGLPVNMRPELEEIRRTGSEVSTLLNKLQEHHSVRQADPDIVDLNSVVIKTAEEVRADQTVTVDGDTRITLDLSSDTPMPAARTADLRRLCRFLIRNAAAAAMSNGGYVTIRTERASAEAVLCVSHTGPVSSTDLAGIFEPHHAGRAGTSSLELAACRSMVRRLRGTIRADANSEQGLSITVQLPLSVKS